eukprot:TRINITY_DN24875_c0_g1_i1.p1 TRINITY_DN24875_c0_g1~~TRINITY_DN24875_c0_g1_i1.p1  ORF type:complete len:722 (+),score=315.58 TRINITY_DN24875_c0_g1_i1:97-2262(+)
MARKASPSFELALGNVIIEGLADVGYFDGVHPALACATAGGKVFVHSPHEKNDPDADGQGGGRQEEVQQKPGAPPIRYLNINRQVTALKVGRFKPETQMDTLMVGTQTNLLAYNVEQNSDLFYKEVQDGINTMTFGKVGSIDTPLVVVGGNCSIQGFDYEGTELYWTVTGDNVTALALADLRGEGQNELLVGSEDYEIRIFRDEEVVTETTETDKVLALEPLYGTRYAYALGNGTIGVYERHTRSWRFKSKHRVVTVCAHDLDSDGVVEVVTGWKNGKLEGRHERSGESVFKDAFPSAVSSLSIADYRMDGRKCLIAASYEGLIRGYLPFERVEDDSAEMDNQLQEAMRLWMQEKQNIERELKTYEENLDKQKKGQRDGGLIPEDTKVTVSIRPCKTKACVELVLKSSQSTIIKMAIVTAEFLFGSNESTVAYADPNNPSSTLSVFFKPEKNVSTQLFIKAIVGNNLGNLFHVFEQEFALPKFAMYVPIKEMPKEKPEGVVSLIVSERVNRVGMWAQQSFNFPYQSQNQNSFHAMFVSLRTGEFLMISMKAEGQMEINAQSMEVVGDIIQDLCQNLGIKEMEATADFPTELEVFSKVIQKVDGYNAVRVQLTMEMADSSQLVKALVIRAEDARILSEMALMRQHYQRLRELNSQLIGEYIKRSNNHTELLSALREVNAMIQKAARLRVGQAKTRVVTECREAIKSNNIPSLFKIIKVGHLK